MRKKKLINLILLTIISITFYPTIKTFAGTQSYNYKYAYDWWLGNNTEYYPAYNGLENSWNKKPNIYSGHPRTNFNDVVSNDNIIKMSTVTGQWISYVKGYYIYDYGWIKDLTSTEYEKYLGDYNGYPKPSTSHPKKAAHSYWSANWDVRYKGGDDTGPWDDGTVNYYIGYYYHLYRQPKPTRTAISLSNQDFKNGNIYWYKPSTEISVLSSYSDPEGWGNNGTTKRRWFYVYDEDNPSSAIGTLSINANGSLNENNMKNSKYFSSSSFQTVTYNEKDNITDKLQIKLKEDGKYKIATNAWNSYAFAHTNSSGSSPLKADFIIAIDGTEPTITGDLSYDWVNTSKSISFTANDNSDGSGMASIVLKNSNGSEVAKGTSSLSYTVSTEGINNFTIIATDNVGNYTTKNVIVKIDQTKPNATFNPNEYSWTNKGIDVTITPSDSGGSEVKEWRYSLSDDNGSSYYYFSDYYTGSKKITLTSAGNNKIQVEVIDNAGNSQTVTSGTYKIDLDKPSGKFNPEDSDWTKNNVKVKFDPSDTGGSGVEKWRYKTSSNNGSSYGSWSSYIIGDTTQEIILSAEGNNKIQVEVTDKAGNVGYVNSGVYKIDKTPPTISGTLDYPWIKDYREINVTAKDSESGIDSLVLKDSNGNEVSWGSDSLIHYVYEEGITTYKLIATDYAGNITEKTVTVRVDNTPPSGKVNYDYNENTFVLDLYVSNIIENGSGLKKVWVEYFPIYDRDNVKSYDLVKSNNTYRETRNLFDLFPNSIDPIGVIVKAVDNVGNEDVLFEEEFDAFKITATINRDWQNYESIFKEGEKGVVNIKLYGGIDSIEIEFPKEFTDIDYSLDTYFNVEPKKYDTTYYEFFVPIGTEQKLYEVKVTGYKNGEAKIVYPTMEVVGNILDKVRTRIR